MPVVEIGSWQNNVDLSRHMMAVARPGKAQKECLWHKVGMVIQEKQERVLL